MIYLPASSTKKSGEKDEEKGENFGYLKSRPLAIKCDKY
jgi:hypothetical protein